MRIFNIPCLAIIGFFITGCTKDFNLKTDKSRPQYVIEGRISTLKGPYYIRVTKVMDVGAAYTPSRYDTTYRQDKAEPVPDAQVTVWDEAGGAIDTLQSIPHLGEPRWNYNFYVNPVDSTWGDNVGPEEYRLGYYKTTKLTGVAGHTYHLKVVIGNQAYEASAYMPPVPTLDSAVNEEITLNGDRFWPPHAYFKEPPGEANYYLLQSNGMSDYAYDYVSGRNTSAGVFPYFVFDDSGLPAYVRMPALVITTDVEKHTIQFGQGNSWGIATQVRLSSLTKEAYDYYTQLQTQFMNDGNVYQPAPASPAGNISNGAIGLFHATAVSWVKCIYR